MKTPRSPEISPLTMFSPARLPIIDRPNTPIRQYSAGPNSSEIFASGSASNSSMTALKVPPIIEAIVHIPIAFRPSPRLVSANPSIAVAADAGVPGVLMREAVMEPP